ncbi:MAG: hydrogenase maturation protease [Bacteroidota bacterium]
MSPDATRAPGYVSPDGETVLIGCGNLLRGDDAAGPIAIRYLWERWGEAVPQGIRVVDGGTAGMDVAFQMRGARRVVIVDACLTGETPGTLYRVPGAEVEDLPPADGINLHAFRWDHALAFARWLLGDEYPTDITVWLVEAAQTDFGALLTPAVDRAVRDLVERLADELATPGAPDLAEAVPATSATHDV